MNSTCLVIWNNESNADYCGGHMVSKWKQRCRQRKIRPHHILKHWKEWQKMWKIIASWLFGRQHFYINSDINFDKGFGHEGSLCQNCS